jgi:hypothetical protein
VLYLLLENLKKASITAIAGEKSGRNEKLKAKPQRLRK